MLCVVLLNGRETAIFACISTAFYRIYDRELFAVFDYTSFLKVAVFAFDVIYLV